MNPAAVYDIETQDWTTFVLGTIHYADGRTEIHRDPASMVAALLAIEGEVWAHNGGRFDHLWLLDAADTYAATVRANSSGIVALQFENTKATFLDSLRVFPMKLDALTAGAKKDLSDLCSCGKDCGGYCAIRVKMPPKVRRRVEEYAVADTVELMHALQHFGNLAAEWGIDIKHTLGATAWASAETDLGLEPFGGTLTEWKACRAGYHGGRTEVFRMESPAGHVHDVNSMYPWALTQPLPIGRGIQRDGAAARRAWNAGKPGVYRATVRVPECWIPPLPYPTDKGVSFPWGTFTASWPASELHAAILAGARVEVHAGIVFQGEREVFTPWVRRLFDLRAKHGKDTREGKWLKWILNSLSGKLGSRNESRRLRVRPDLMKIATCKCIRRRPPPVECECGSWRPLDGSGVVWEQRVTMRDVEGCAHPEWAAYLTGYARVALHRQLTAGRGDAVYCDTDSVWSEGPRETNVGPGLGEWNPEGTYRGFECLGPKSYHAEVLKGGQVGEVTRMKGIPAPSWEVVKSGAATDYVSFAGLRRAKGGKFFERLPQSRRVTRHTGRRLPGPKGDARTYPPRE